MVWEGRGRWWLNHGWMRGGEQDQQSPEMERPDVLGGVRRCYGLDECSPGPTSSRDGAIGNGATFGRWDLVGGPKVTGSVSWKGIVGSWPLPPLFLLPGQEVSSLLCYVLSAIASDTIT